MPRTGQASPRFPKAVPAAMLVTALAIEVTSAATIRVATDGTGASLTIQHGIDLAISGDTVLVEPGTC